MLTPSTRPSSAVLAVCGGLAAAFAVAGPDLFRLPSMNQRMHAETLRSQDLDARREQVARLSLLKRSIAADVITGRRTLAEAAALYQELHATEREVALFRGKYGHDSDAHCMGRNVLAFIDVVLLEHGPDDADDVRARVAEDLTAFVAAGQAGR